MIDLILVEREYYFKITLVLHKLFHALHNLLQDFPSWENAFVSYEQPPKMKSFIKNTNNYYVGRRWAFEQCHINGELAILEGQPIDDLHHNDFDDDSIDMNTPPR